MPIFADFSPFCPPTVPRVITIFLHHTNYHHLSLWHLGIVDVLANLMVELFAGYLGKSDCKKRHFLLKAMDGVGCHLLQGKRLSVVTL